MQLEFALTRYVYSLWLLWTHISDMTLCWLTVLLLLLLLLHQKLATKCKHKTPKTRTKVLYINRTK